MLGTFHLGGNRRAQCGFLFGSIWLLLLHPDCGRVVGENSDITGDNGKEQLRMRYTFFLRLMTSLYQLQIFPVLAMIVR